MNESTNIGPQQKTEHNIKKNNGEQQMTGHNKLTRPNKQMENVSQQTKQQRWNNITIDRAQQHSRQGGAMQHTSRNARAQHHTM